MDYPEAPKATVGMAHRQQFSIPFDGAVLAPFGARADRAGDQFPSLAIQLSSPRCTAAPGPRQPCEQAPHAAPPPPSIPPVLRPVPVLHAPPRSILRTLLLTRPHHLPGPSPPLQPA